LADYGGIQSLVNVFCAIGSARSLGICAAFLHYRKVIHVPIGTTQQMKMSCATFKATTENPPMAPFAKGGGPKVRGIFASNRHFHKSVTGLRTMD
jgi:hypothetical protein